MDKEVVHIHNGMLLSHKKECLELVLMRWINLEPIIQNEVSQKEKAKCHILTYMNGIQKNGTGKLIYIAAMEKQIQRIDSWTWGEEWKG